MPVPEEYPRASPRVNLSHIDFFIRLPVCHAVCLFPDMSPDDYLLDFNYACPWQIKILVCFAIRHAYYFLKGLALGSRNIRGHASCFNDGIRVCFKADTIPRFQPRASRQGYIITVWISQRKFKLDMGRFRVFRRVSYHFAHVDNVLPLSCRGKVGLIRLMVEIKQQEVRIISICLNEHTSGVVLFKIVPVFLAVTLLYSADAVSHYSFMVFFCKLEPF